MKPIWGTENSDADRERVFQIPAGYDIPQLAKDLAAWLAADKKMKTEVVALEGGWLVQGQETGGRLRRLVSRKAEFFHLVLVESPSELTVRLGYGETPVAEPSDTKKFSLKNAASFAFDAASSLAESVTTGLSDLWVDSGTADEIFGFIGRQIADQFRALSGQQTGMIDPDLSRYVTPRATVESTWLAGYLQPGEILLAWLKTASAPPEHREAEWRYLLTTERAALAAFTEARFVSLAPLPQAPMSVTNAFGKDTVTVRDHTWQTRFTNDTLFQEVARLSDLGPLDRLYQAARLNFLHAEKTENRLVYARQALSYLSERSARPLHTLSRLYVERVSKGKSGTGGFESISPLSANDVSIAKALMAEISGDRLLQWADSWKISPWDRIALAALLQDTVPESKDRAQWLHPLIRSGRENLETRNQARQILADLRYARNIHPLGRQAEAVHLLEKRLSDLPDESLADLLPAPDADLTKGEGGQLMRVRILEALVDLRGVPDADDVETLRELAVLQPLVPERLQRLYDAGDEGVQRQVAVPLRLLERGGLKDETPPASAPAGKMSPLTPEEIRNRIRHPASREGTTVHRLQGMIAAKHVPDHSSLKSFARRVTPEAYPDISGAIADGTLMLRMAAVEAYIAFGEMDTGIRGYEGKPSFILIGGQHLEPESPVRMSPAELRFLTGGELAHIKFGHERITSREVWEGVFEKTMSLVELFPVVGGYLGKIGKLGRVAGHATDTAKKIGNVKQYIGHARDVVSTTQNMFRGNKGAVEAPPEQKRSDEEDLVGAFRVMQLTADRAGLVLCGDLRAAVRAIFKSGPRLLVELPTAEEYGLYTFLSRTDEKGNLLYQELAIRIAALFSFYFSDDYPKRLREMADQH